MKVIAVMLVMSFSLYSGFAQDMSKRASPLDSTSATIGDAEVHIIYSRPSKKGREIFGGLVPYDKIWRTGANEATVFRVNEKVRVGGEALPAGEYALFTIPGKEEWTIIFNKQAEQWGAYRYDKEQDQLRITVPVESTKQMEMFTIKAENNGKIHLMWDETKVAFEIQP